MNDRIILILSAAIPSAVLGILFLVALVPKSNPIGDGGFESGSLVTDAAQPGGFWGSTGDRFGGGIAITGEDRHSGRYSVKIISNTTSAAYIYQYFDLDTSQYTYSFWYKGSGNATGNVATGWGPPPWFLGGPYDPQQSGGIALGGPWFPMDGQWHKASIVNAGAKQAYLLDGRQVACDTGSAITPTVTIIGDGSTRETNTMLLYIDDVSLVSGQEFQFSCP